MAGERRTTRLALGAGLLAACVACSSGTPTPTASSSGAQPVPASSNAPPTPAPPSGSTPTSTAASSPVAPPSAAAKMLPRGGRTVFPRYRLVGYAGRTGGSTLGRLGTGGLDGRVREMIRRAEPYTADGRELLPVMEVIATVVQSSPGRDGTYRIRMSDREVARYLKVARRHKAVLLLAIQPGRADFLSEVRAYERWLKEPDVGVALDPEWAMGKGQVPGRVFGHTTGKELDTVSRYLSQVVAKQDLPEKIMVFHELAPQIVTGESRLRPHRGVAVVKSVDGIGVPAAKRHTYRLVNEDTPSFVKPGFKLFYTEDAKPGPLMKPAQVLALKPRPAYVLYE